MKQNQTTKVQPKKYIQFSPKNDEQEECAQLIEDNDIIFVYGLSGSGKSHITAGIAAKQLKSKLVENIILVRSSVGSETIGFLPGNSVEKVGVYLSPILNELNYFLDVDGLMKRDMIKIQPLLSMRGLTFKDSFVIIEECQNLNLKQLKLVLTRIGQGSKLVFTGDFEQSDLGKNSLKNIRWGLSQMATIATKENRIACIELLESVRHPLIKIILEALEENEIS